MVAVGQIAGSNGVRGDVRVKPLTPDLGRFAGLNDVWIGESETEARRFSIQQVRFHRSQIILKLHDVGSRTAADELRDQYIFIDESNTRPPAEGSFFIHDILGMSVFTEEGVAVGVVKEVWRLPANDVWVLQKEEKELLVPAVKEIVRAVDLKRRVITIHAMQGLIEDSPGDT